MTFVAEGVPGVFFLGPAASDGVWVVAKVDLHLSASPDLSRMLRNPNKP